MRRVRVRLAQLILFFTGIGLRLADRLNPPPTIVRGDAIELEPVSDGHYRLWVAVQRGTDLTLESAPLMISDEDAQQIREFLKR